MNTRFLELYSEHRNRQQYPNPSNFIVPFQASSNQSTVDPIINGAVFYTWKASASAINSGILKNGSTNSTPLLSNKNGNQPSAVNAYLGCQFYNCSTNQTRLILEYQPSSCSLTLQEACSNTTAGQPYIIYDISTNSAIHLPYQDNYGNSINDYAQAYTNYYIIDETLSYGTTIVAECILSYDFTTRTARLAAPFPANWSQNDSYTLRQSLPLEKWTLTTQSFYNQDPSIGPLGAVITLPPGASSTDHYTGKYIYFYSNSPPPNPNQFIFQPIYGTFFIKSYNGATRQAFVDGDLSGSPLPYQCVQTGIFLAGSTVTHPILSNGSSQDRSYINYLLTNDRTGQTSVITSYNGLTRTAMIDPPFSSIMGDSYQLITPQGINITSFTRDNFVGLDYIGTMVSVNTAVCYEVTLIDLILPNVPLVTGSSAAYYPFLYVQLTNVSASEKASTELIYSNNPASKTALFIVPVTDIVSPMDSRFIKLNASRMAQTIKFKPNDSFRFSVTLPDGSYFQPVQPDLTTPYAANSQLQVHATFSLRRL